MPVKEGELLCGGCEQFLGTTNTVLCYRQTLRKPLLLLQTGLVNMFVTEEAFVVLKFENYPG
jgi:hypothetical protein